MISTVTVLLNLTGYDPSKCTIKRQMDSMYIVEKLSILNLFSVENHISYLFKIFSVGSIKTMLSP
jgi:hypothetical protein